MNEISVFGIGKLETVGKKIDMRLEFDDISTSMYNICKTKI